MFDTMNGESFDSLNAMHEAHGSYVDETGFDWASHYWE